ncbi:MAG: D-cysteine desulfhydrase family protein [Parvibaculum sp.]|uniref:D-cysteine desulfhydrase family protein n=1 Tax=Parvibaculum sp. TaxID=2024848 RepID=UPI0025F76776|nr:D-cysteine desulfhydrase family protein [Parvibaculum sp.]MCE9650552.1 D-cysteine desulfhydrase family protein [Parvibaculum sp.]
MSDPFSAFPRFPLAHLPTPLGEMKRLRAALGPACPPLFIKRDDCTGLAGGGNKTRKLEFLIGEAIAEGCDTIVTTGALQSNHARQTAAAANAAGLRATLVLMDMVPYEGGAYRRSGNRLLDDILGADVKIIPPGADAGAFFKQTMAEIEAGGRKAYFTPAGGSTVTGSLGYAAAYVEIADELAARGLAGARLVHASSSGGTQAGLVAGRALRPGGPAVHGINVYRLDADKMEADIGKLAATTAERLGVATPPADAIVLEHGFVGPRYGVPTPEMIEAVELVARTEGILLDPVYTGKGMAGFLSLIRRGDFAQDGALVFLHTGGMPGLFAYEGEFLRKI